MATRLLDAASCQLLLLLLLRVRRSFNWDSLLLEEAESFAAIMDLLRVEEEVVSHRVEEEVVSHGVEEEVVSHRVEKEEVVSHRVEEVVSHRVVEEEVVSHRVVEVVLSDRVEGSGGGGGGGAQ